MSDFPGEPWSDNPNAPHISTELHTADKRLFVGRVIGAIPYGVVIILFFQCMEALIEPVDNIRRRVKWGLAIHTTALFLFLTIHTTMDLRLLSIGYIDNRNFPGTGPLGHDDSANFSTAFVVIYTVMFPLSQWLVDGFLLYRCYVIYSMDYWVMIFPCLMYVASLATGIASTYSISRGVTPVPLSTAYYLICLSLNILLTLMITTRLVLHSRNIRQATGASDGATGLYSTIVTILVESCALYAAALVFYVVPFTIGSWFGFIPVRIIAHVQVIAPYLVILRVAKRRALTGEMVTSGFNNVDSIQFASQTTTSGDSSLPDGDCIHSTQANGEGSDEVCTMGENGIEEVLSRQGQKIP